MGLTCAGTPKLLAVSDLHVGFPENREIVADLRPRSPEDWLLVAGDVGEHAPDNEWAQRTRSDRFATVVWVPGAFELPLVATSTPRSATSTW